MKKKIFVFPSKYLDIHQVFEQLTQKMSIFNIIKINGGSADKFIYDICLLYKRTFPDSSTKK